MHFELNKGRNIIRASAKIHNFLVDYREAHMVDVRDDFISLDETVTVFRDMGADIKGVGRPTEEEAKVTHIGIGLRKRLATDLVNAGLVRCTDRSKRRKTYGRQN